MPDQRFESTSDHALFHGSELLIRGLVESPGYGAWVSGQVGIPSDALGPGLDHAAAALRECSISVQMGATARQAVAAMMGAMTSGRCALGYVDSLGFQDAADALTSAMRLEPDPRRGGLVVVRDDPSGRLSPTVVDSRFLAAHLRIPTLAPANAQQVKDWVALALEMSSSLGGVVAMQLTAELTQAGATVACQRHRMGTGPTTAAPSSLVRRRRITAADFTHSGSIDQEAAIERRLAAVRIDARRLGINTIVGRPAKGEQAPLGLVASGQALDMVHHALWELGAAGRVPILSLGLAYPVDEAAVAEFLAMCQRVVVVEAQRGFLERHVQEIASRARQAGRKHVAEVFGKSFDMDLPGIPPVGPLDLTTLTHRLGSLIEALAEQGITGSSVTRRATVTRVAPPSVLASDLPSRTPTFCAGCPHRDTASVLHEIKRNFADAQHMLERHGCEPIDLLIHGEAGCASLLSQPPHGDLVQSFAGRGLAGAVAYGVEQGAADPLQSRHVALMGDASFFAGGQSVIAHAIERRQDIVFVILENKTAAFEGQRPIMPGSADAGGGAAEPAPKPTSSKGAKPGELSWGWRETDTANIESIVGAMMPRLYPRDSHVVRVDPSQRSRYRNLLEDSVMLPGVKVVIASKPCALIKPTEQDLARQPETQVPDLGFKPRRQRIRINTDVCEYCLACTQDTGCPGLDVVETDHGPKIQTDRQACVDDGACQRIRACPAFEKVTIQRQQAPHHSQNEIDLTHLPEPARPIHAMQGLWRCHVAGLNQPDHHEIAGVLLEAGGLMGYHVQYLRHQAPAARTGPGHWQIAFSRSGQDLGQPSARMTAGNADVLLGMDLLETAHAIDPGTVGHVARTQHTAMVVLNHLHPTQQMLAGSQRTNPRVMRSLIEHQGHPDRRHLLPLYELADQLMGDTELTSLMVLGAAFQWGYLPATLLAMEQAIRQRQPRQAQRRIRAWRLGRLWAASPEKLKAWLSTADEKSPRQLLREKTHWLAQRFVRPRQKQVVRRFRTTLRPVLDLAESCQLDDSVMRDLIVAAYDNMVWGGELSLRRYLGRVRDALLIQEDHPDRSLQLPPVIIRGLARLMLIKDEIYVAALLVDPQKQDRDRRQLHIDPARGDRVSYRHWTYPHIDLWGIRLNFEWRARPWQLKLLSHCRWLRKLPNTRYAPQWQYLQWYEQLVDRALAHCDQDVAQDEPWSRVLRTGAQVVGFGDRRLKQMAQTQQEVAHMLGSGHDQAHSLGNGPSPRQDGSADQGQRFDAEASRVRLPVIDSEPPSS